MSSIFREGHRHKASCGTGGSNPIEKIFKAYLIELAENEIIYLQHKSIGGRLPNGAFNTIINSGISVDQTIIKNMIMIKLTRM